MRRDERAGTRHVVSRTISSGSTMISPPERDSELRMRPSKVSAAMRPISRRGCRTVVNAGSGTLRSEYHRILTTETGLGTSSFASRKARIAPIAEMSLNANSAVKGRPTLSSFRVAS